MQYIKLLMILKQLILNPWNQVWPSLICLVCVYLSCPVSAWVQVCWWLRWWPPEPQRSASSAARWSSSAHSAQSPAQRRGHEGHVSAERHSLFMKPQEELCSPSARLSGWDSSAGWSCCPDSVQTLPPGEPAQTHSVRTQPRAGTSPSLVYLHSTD